MKFEKQVSLKWAIALVLIACLVSSSIVYYVFAVSPSSTFTISSGVYPGAPSYTVWREGSNYFAKDANGEIDYSGTNASYVIESAINALTAGGKIFIKAGTYILSATLNLVNNLILEGEGFSTILRDESQNTVSPQNVIYASGKNKIAIRNLMVQGNAGTTDLADRPNGHGITFDNVTDFIIENVRCEYLRQSGINIGPSVTCENGLLNNIECVGYRMALLNVGKGKKISLNNFYGKSIEGLLIEHGPCEKINFNNVIVEMDESVAVGAGYAIQVLANEGDIKEVSISNAKVWGKWLCGVRVYATLVGTTNYNIERVTLSNIICDMREANSNYGFWLGADSGSILDNLDMTNCQSYGAAAVDGFRFDNVKSARVVNCLSKLSSQQGFGVFGGSVVHFLNCKALDNNVQNLAGNSGFYVDNSTVYLVNCLATDDRATKLQDYGLRGVTATSYLNAWDNDFRNNKIAGVLVGTNNVWYGKYNQGFVTENSGTATITASTTVTFNHGLAGTPTHVECGFQNAGYGSWIWSATSTQITITVTTSGTYTFSWYAEYKP